MAVEGCFNKHVSHLSSINRHFASDSEVSLTSKAKRDFCSDKSLAAHQTLRLFFCLTLCSFSFMFCPIGTFAFSSFRFVDANWFLLRIISLLFLCHQCLRRNQLASTRASVKGLLFGAARTGGVSRTRLLQFSDQPAVKFASQAGNLVYLERERESHFLGNFDWQGLPWKFTIGPQWEILLVEILFTVVLTLLAVR